MFFFLSKFLVVFIRPLVWILVLLLYSLFGRNGKRKRRALRLGIGLLFVFTNPIISNVVADWWEAEPVLVSDLKDNYDYGVILGGFGNFEVVENEDRLNLGLVPNRLTHTLDLYFQGKIKKIVLSGGNGNIVGHEENEAEKTAAYFDRIGIPKEDYLIENNSRNTYENFVNTKALLNKIQEGKCLVISSAFHIPRSQGIAKKVGLNCDFYPTDFFFENWTLAPSQTIIPDVDRFRMWKVLIKEWVGYVVYKMKGYL